MSDGRIGFSVLGDSISTLQGWVPEGWRVHYEGEVRIAGVEHPRDTWWGRVIFELGGRLVANSSFSGSMVDGFGFPAGISDERIDALAAEGVLPDVVLVYSGINDYGWGSALNQVRGGSASASARREDVDHSVLVADGDICAESAAASSVALVVGSDALARFQRAYSAMLGKIRRLAPHAEVWCITLAPGTERPVPNSLDGKPASLSDGGLASGSPAGCYKYSIRGVPLDDYNQAIRAAAEQGGAHVADVRAFGVCYDAVDGVHPSALGMRQLAAMVVAQMRGLPADPSLVPELSSALPSTRMCFRPHCGGCPFADDDPARWTLCCDGPVR